jgi:hypothetical protein
MITKEQLHIYRTHWGNLELLYREGRPAEIKELEGGAWNRIEALIKDARTLADGPASPELAAELRTRIQDGTADEATRQLLQHLARAWPRIRPRWPLYLFQSLILGLFMALAAVSDGVEWLAKSLRARSVAKLLLWVALGVLLRYVVVSAKH